LLVFPLEAYQLGAKDAAEAIESTRDYEKCADDILSLDLLDNVINKRVGVNKLFPWRFYMAASAFDKWWNSQPSMGSELVAAHEAWDAATKLAEEKVFIHQQPQPETDVLITILKRHLA